MFYARIRKIGDLERTTAGIIGAHSNDLRALEDLWHYVRINLNSYLPTWAVPSCPPYIQGMELLKHITPEDTGYICNVGSTAVFYWKFFPQGRFLVDNGPYILEVWESDTDYALPKEYHAKSND